MRRQKRRIAAAFMCGAVAALCAPDAAEMSRTVAALKGYDYGKSGRALRAVEQLIGRTYGNADIRAAIERELAGVLSSDASLALKGFVCRQLAVFGTDTSVPALASMLGDADENVVEMACFALSRRPTAGAAAALRSALTEAKGAGLVAVITLLGDRRDAQSAGAIAKIAANGSGDAAEAAVAALGKIATAEAVAALDDLRKGKRGDAATHAYLRCAQELAARGEREEALRLYAELCAPGEPPHVRRGALRARAVLLRDETVARLRQPAVPLRDQTVLLFDGATLAGWEGNEKWFRVEDGAIVAGTLKEPIPRNEFLCTKEHYGDFELRATVKLVGEGQNAGIQIRSRRVPGSHEVSGFQADMGTGCWGCLYDESRRNRMLATADEQELAKVLRPDDWNDYTIRCKGDRIQLWINGYKTVDYVETDPNIPRSGVIGLQIHGGAPSEAWYKDIRMTELRAEE